MRIRHKILAGYLALLAAAVVLVAFFLFTISDINRRYSDLISREQATLLQANNLRSAVQRQIVAARSYELSPDSSLLNEYNDANKQQQEAIEKIGPALTSEDDRKLLEDIQNASLTYTQLEDGIIEVVSSSKAPLAPTVARSETARLALSNLIEVFIVRKNQQVADAQVALGARVEDISAQLLAWSLVGVFITLIAVTLFTEGFTAPLRRLMHDIQGITHGDLETTITIRSKDEIGELAGVVEQMRRRLSVAAAENESLLSSARQEAEKLAETQFELERANVGLHKALVTESEARKRIEEINRLKSEFAGMISHELKTPVSYVYNYAGALKEHGASLNESQRSEFLTSIQGEAQHLLTLIDDILAMSLLDVDGLTYRFVETDLRKITDSVVKDHQLTTRRHTITIKGPEHLPVRGDPTRLKQVLNNLLSNAIKYSPQGGPIEVRLRANDLDNTAMIYIRDNGLGIDPKDIPKLFDRYSRISRRETVAIPGSGLGLYIAHQIVEAHGGVMSLQPAPGKGTIAEMCIPLLELVPEDDEEPTVNSPRVRRSQRHAHRHPVTTNGSQRPVTQLVADSGEEHTNGDGSGISQTAEKGLVKLTTNAGQ